MNESAPSDHLLALRGDKSGKMCSKRWSLDLCVWTGRYSILEMHNRCKQLIPSVHRPHPPVGFHPHGAPKGVVRDHEKGVLEDQIGSRPRKVSW